MKMWSALLPQIAFAKRRAHKPSLPLPALFAPLAVFAPLALPGISPLPATADASAGGPRGSSSSMARTKQTTLTLKKAGGGATQGAVKAVTAKDRWAPPTGPLPVLIGSSAAVAHGVRLGRTPADYDLVATQEQLVSACLRAAKARRRCDPVAHDPLPSNAPPAVAHAAVSRIAFCRALLRCPRSCRALLR